MFTGRVARIAPGLDPATRTFPIEIEIPNSGFRLKPGMYGRVGITTQEKPDALIIPANALVDVGGERGVFLAKDGNTAAFRPVEVGIEEDARVEILEGLSEGDQVVTTGAAALRDGDRFLLGGDRGDGEGTAATAGAAASVGPNAPVQGEPAGRRGGREGFRGRRGGQPTP
jgi:multidrug efflux pump subunit AcrA (membrane-fusion protein)